MTIKHATWIDFVVFAKEADTGNTMSIFILDAAGNVAVDLDADSAREVAERLVAMADEWDGEKTRPPLRRLPDVDERLRGLDG